MNRYLEGHPPAVFDHPLNIHHGRARLIFARATVVTSPGGEAKTIPEGWVLPGGARIQNHEQAMSAAARLDDLIRLNSCN